MTITHLEGALRHWENVCYILHTESVISKLSGQSPEVRLPEEGPLVNVWTFRKHLLSLQQESFDYAKYVGSPEIQQVISHYGNFLQWLPCTLAVWTKSSRRIFRVSSDLGYLLMATSLRGMSWNDVPWPFDSFAIDLELPILDSRGNKIDHILVAKETGYVAKQDVISVRGFSPNYREVRSIGIQTRLKVTEAIRKKKWDLPYQLLTEASPSGTTAHSIASYINDMGSIENDKPVEFTDLREKEMLIEPADEHQEFDMMLRLVVGLCFYLKTLPPGSSHASSWVKAPNPTKDKMSVMDTAQVCTVTNTYSLNPEERDVLKKIVTSGIPTLIEVRAHFRRGFWRRMPGCGDNPLAPKIVHVRPCIVRKDRLPPGSAPSGIIGLIE